MPALTLPMGALAGSRMPLTLPGAAMRKPGVVQKACSDFSPTSPTDRRSDFRGYLSASGSADSFDSSRYSSLTSGSHDAEAVRTLLSETVLKRKRLILTHTESGCEAKKLSESYEVEEQVVGQGGFGTVYKARLREAPSVVRAVKKVSKRNLKALDFVRREIAILRRLDHPAICRLLETFEDAKAIYLVMEFIEGRELFDEIVEQSPDSLDEKQASNIMRHVLCALKYCHARGVMHRDLKPENIMVSACGSSEREVKLIDFGLAVMSSKSLRRTYSSFVGTADYQAPEAKVRGGTLMPISDVWSAGMVLHALLVGRLPSSAIISGQDTLQLSAPEYSRLSNEARDLLGGLLQPDPGRRLTAAGASAHCWVSNGPEKGTTPLSASDCTATMSSFSTFQRSAKIRRAALTVLAMQLTSQQLGDLRERFLAMDTDGNGRISKEELAQSIALAAPGGATEDVKDWVDSVFDSIDTDGSRQIEYTEWLAAAVNVGTIRSEMALRAAFRVFDLNGDGVIDAKEFGHVLSETPEEVAALLPQFDSDGDGRIDFNEFCAVFNDPLSPLNATEEAFKPAAPSLYKLNL